MDATGHQIDVRPHRTLWLLSIAHAVNHAQAVLLPLIFLKIIDEFHTTEGSVAILAAAGAFASGAVQLSYASLTRIISRKRLLGAGGILFGGGFAAQAFASSLTTFAIPNILSRMGGSPQHPVGNGLLAEQFSRERRGFAISAHIAGGNVGTVVVALIGVPMIAAFGWRGASIAVGRRLAIGPYRAKAADHRGLPGRGGGLRRVHPRRLQPARPVAGHRDHGFVQLCREPAAPGPSGRHRAAVNS